MLHQSRLEKDFVAIGSGSGLSIVDWMIRAHEGSIDVESQEGQGSTFTLSIPLAHDT
ncbi:MAG: ATP-binding protein [Ktedonobacteraceae bacterium]